MNAFWFVHELFVSMVFRFRNLRKFPFIQYSFVIFSFQVSSLEDPRTFVQTSDCSNVKNLEIEVKKNKKIEIRTKLNLRMAVSSYPPVRAPFDRTFELFVMLWFAESQGFFLQKQWMSGFETSQLLLGLFPEIASSSSSQTHRRRFSNTPVLFSIKS